VLERGQGRHQINQCECARDVLEWGRRFPLGEDAIPSIEIVLGLAVVVLGARCVALFQAAVHVPEVHRRLLGALESQDPEIGRLVRNLGFQSPYAELAGALIRAVQGSTETERKHVLKTSATHSRAVARRRFQRGQALDLVALALAVGIAAFAQEGLPAGTVFWALGGALLTVLILTLLARARLYSAMDASLHQLVESLAQRPSVPPPHPTRSKPGICPTCGRELPPEQAHP
jgi:hypothetical protein